MPKAVWNGVVVAESDHVETVEGNAHFPPDSIHKEFFEESDTQSLCPWKGTASYYTLEVDGDRNEDAAWFCADPSAAASNIKNHVAFWRGVTVSD